MSSNYRAQAGLAVNGPGPWRSRSPLTPAPLVRRWWARVLDAIFVLFCTGTVVGVAIALAGIKVISLDAATGVALASYPLMALVFGALYGCTVSPARRCAESSRSSTAADASDSGGARRAIWRSRSSRSRSFSSSGRSSTHRRWTWIRSTSITAGLHKSGRSGSRVRITVVAR